MQGNPAAVSWGPGHIDVFARGPNNELEDEWFDNGSWHDWGNLGGTITSSPSATSPGPGRVNIFARWADGDLWSIWYSDGWGSWGDVGCCLAGDITTSVAATSQGFPTADVFVIGTQHDLYRRHFDWYNGGWADWQYLDHSFDFTNIAAVAWMPVAPPPPPTATRQPTPTHCTHQPCISPQ
jgi:hypothetical protein